MHKPSSKFLSPEIRRLLGQELVAIPLENTKFGYISDPWNQDDKHLAFLAEKDEPIFSRCVTRSRGPTNFQPHPDMTDHCYRSRGEHSEAPAPAEGGWRVPGFPDLSCQLLCPRCLLAPPHLRGLPLRLCSVAYCCQLVGQPVLLPRSFSFYLGLYSEERSVKICRLSFSS